MQTVVKQGQCAKLLVFCLLLGCAGRNSWDSAVAKANQSNQVLIVEFYADWCGPCARFEADVLSQADVKSALKAVEFRRYDFDSSEGRRHADRLGIRAIPSVVAVDRDGEGFKRLRGIVPKSAFLEFLRQSQEHIYAPKDPSPEDSF